MSLELWKKEPPPQPPENAEVHTTEMYHESDLVIEITRQYNKLAQFKRVCIIKDQESNRSWASSVDQIEISFIQMSDADCIFGSGSSDVDKKRKEKSLRLLFAPGVDLPVYSIVPS